jgi:hypothetical protein
MYDYETHDDYVPQLFTNIVNAINPISNQLISLLLYYPDFPFFLYPSPSKYDSAFFLNSKFTSLKDLTLTTAFISKSDSVTSHLRILARSCPVLLSLKYELTPLCFDNDPSGYPIDDDEKEFHSESDPETFKNFKFEDTSNWDLHKINQIKLTSFPLFRLLNKLVLLGVPLNFQCFEDIHIKLPNLTSFRLIDCCDSSIPDAPSFDPEYYFMDVVNLSSHLNHLLLLNHLQTLAFHRLSAQTSIEADNFIQLMIEFGKKMNNLNAIKLFFSSPSKCFRPICVKQIGYLEWLKIFNYCSCTEPHHGRFIPIDSESDEY